MKVSFQLETPFLYKYCDTRGIDILQSLRLKVTPPIEFNDPFEFMPKLEFHIDKQSLAKRLASTSLLKSIWKDFPVDIDFESFREAYLRELNHPKSPHVKNTIRALQSEAAKARDGIVSFMSSQFVLTCYSEIPDSFLMWSHYTKGHQGVVVCFNVKNRFFRQGENLMPVVYRSERMNASYGHSGLKFLEPSIVLLRTKSPDWIYEKEWRQFFPIRKCKKLRSENGTINYFQSIPPDAISSVILGVRCKPDTESAVRELLRTKPLRHVQLRRAVLHEREFRLKIVKT
jgi:hypothetical protein